MPILSFGQTSHEIVNKVQKEICAKFNSYDDFEKISIQEKAQAISQVLNENEREWNSELDKIENSRNNGYTIFDELLIHQLELNCPKFNDFYPSLNNYLVDNSTKRNQYLKARRFVISLETNSNIQESLKFLNPKINDDSLRQKLISLQKELKKFNNNSILHFLWSESLDGSVIVANNQNYRNGDTNVLIKIFFEDNDDNLIDGIVFKNKTEVEKDRKLRESDLPSNIPPPPPPPKKNGD